MTRLSATDRNIELANYDTQILIQDLNDGSVEIYMEHEEDKFTKDVAFGNFTKEEICGLADLLYLRYSRKADIGGTAVDYDAKR